jgi:putative methyltransferase (TIGR04325 family)
MERVRAGEQFVDRDESLKHLAYGYVIALAARRPQPLRVLDYGGNLGDYYWIAKSFVPGIELEYHCKELPAVAAAGRELNPDISWHVDDGCLAQTYDVVMFSSSLQCVGDWRAILRRGARAARGFLFLSDVATVRHVPTFFARHHSGAVSNLQQHLNRAEIISLVESEGLRLVREFDMGPHPEVEHAPEQPVSMGWLFSAAK